MKLDDSFLKEVGLVALPENQKEAFLEYVEEEVEVRIGKRISEGVSEEKMREFENTTSDEEALAWLEENRPDFREVVDEVVEGIKEEIRNNRDKIL